MKTGTNQRLTNEQIHTIKHLKENGVRISIIARVLKTSYGVSLSTAYYHCSDNRESYDYHARKVREARHQQIQQKICGMIKNGMTTQDIAIEWNMPLAQVNKIYIR